MKHTLEQLTAMPARELDCIVAGLMGWNSIRECDYYEGYSGSDDEIRQEWVGLDPKEDIITAIPKFSDSLDAMHEAEKVLPEDRKANYADRIWSEIPLLDLGEHIENEDRFAGDMYGFVTATARQRAIAFVLTMQG